MATSTKTHEPTPEIVFQTLQAYQRSQALKAAIELDVFTAIGEGKRVAGELAGRCRASERGMRILCDFLVITGFLTKEGHGYGLTPEAEMFLDRRSPAYLGSIANFLLAPEITRAYQDLAAAVRKGGTVLDGDGTLAPENPIWVEFARSMTPMMRVPAEMIAELLDAGAGRKWKVLDIAAGHGLFGITLAKHNPNAEIFALDWPNVLAVAQENAQAAGVAGRHKTIPGSAFEADFGKNYDLVLLTNFLHHFDISTCETLLGKVHRALVPGGRAVTLEFIPNDDRISPPQAASFSLTMLGSTPNGDAYTFSEFERMFRNAGFSRSKLHPLPQGFQQVVISYR